MSKILKLIRGTEADVKIAKILIRKKPEIIRDLKVIIRYKMMRHYGEMAYTIERFDRNCMVHFFVVNSLYSKEDIAVSRMDKQLPDITKTNYLYNRALAALRRLKKDQY